MALRNCKTNYYIKIDLRGNYIIYLTPRDRDLEKQAPKQELIIQKYNSLISSLQQNHERYYYDPSFRDYVQTWETEYARYQHCIAQQTTPTEDFPLISQYFLNVTYTIPTIIQKGHIAVRGNTLEEVYNFIKQYKIFGEVEDC